MIQTTNSKRSVLVIGGRGQLGSRIRASAIARGFHVLPYDLHINHDHSSIHRAILKNEPNIVINCAAKTDVDWCEKQENRADAVGVNALAVEAMAKAVRVLGKDHVLVHISSDMIFGGKHLPFPPWSESEIAMPINFYGMTKYMAEVQIHKHKPQALVVRLQNVWSSSRGPGVMIRDLSELTVPEMQVAPTSARIAASDIMTLVSEGWLGTFNIAPSDSISLPEAASILIANIKNPACDKFKPVPADEFFANRARRHYSSRLSVETLSGVGSIRIRTAREHLLDIAAEINEDRQGGA